MTIDQTNKIYLAGADGACIYSNLNGDEYRLFENCQSSNEQISTQTGPARHGKVDTDAGSVYLVCYGKDMRKSSTLFRNEQKLLIEVLPTLSSAHKRALTNFMHDIPKIHGHNIQEVFSLIPQWDFEKKTSVEEQLHFIREKLASNPEKAARAVLKIIKNNSAISNEFDILDYLSGHKRRPQFDSHKIHKVLQRVLVNFYSDFYNLHVLVNIAQTDESVIIDFDSFRGALIPFFDNAVKYVFPNSDIDISFNVVSDQIVIKVKMLSLAIKGTELISITKEGIVGEMAEKSGKSGDGLGLPKIIQLLNISNGQLTIFPHYESRSVSLNGLDYETNLFEIKVKRHIGSV